MRLINFLAGLAILTTASMVNAQMRAHSSAGSSSSTNTGNASSNERGRGAMTQNAGSSVVRPAQPGTNSGKTISVSVPDRDRDRGDRDHDGDGDHDRRRRAHILPVTVGAPVYYTDYISTDTTQNNPSQPEQPQPETPAPTIFENRPGYTPPPIKPYQPTYQTAESQPQSVPQAGSDVQGTSAAEPQPTTILVFRDGHMIEIGNYAIVGDTLYNLSGDYRSHKILLSDLDLDKTVKINQERGYDFRLPKLPKA